MSETTEELRTEARKERHWTARTAAWRRVVQLLEIDERHITPRVTELVRAWNAGWEDAIKFGDDTLQRELAELRVQRDGMAADVRSLSASLGRNIEELAELREEREGLTDRQLVMAYRAWSEEFYAASFLSPDEHTVRSFMKWWNSTALLAIEDYEAEMLRLYRQALAGGRNEPE